MLGSVLESTYAAFVASFPLLCEGYGRASDRDTPVAPTRSIACGNCETGRGYRYATRDSFGRDICANCVLGILSRRGTRSMRLGADGAAEGGCPGTAHGSRL